ncbi:enoyl-CoA hydratase/isomerase family protein [Pelotalea chapellei]|uniref:Enoyl-CoA hydratase/isomerase family protein n=1 Tax=Pelotalea chapellei TaxID=44671 RepID=A0ABS5U8L4_9BACT|nr:enoyl-CoA hydratase/isomerase family protein [Pelotalea chapellei]MBT1071997.1 enoyl-CoA hydratase/isomerase family protein [Pelotalea chapellei]
MPFKHLHLETENQVGYLLLGAGTRFNKLSVTTIRELKRALGQMEQDGTINTIVISGYPGESFAVGADIGQMLHFSPTDALRFAQLGQSLFDQIESCSKPVIGALNGITMGGGCDLAMACDIRIAVDTLQIAHPGARIGIITGFCGTRKLPRIVGKNAAREIFMTSEPYTASEALRMGLVDRVHPEKDFWPMVKQFAARIAAHPAETLSTAKKVLNASEDIDLKSGCALEAALNGTLWNTRSTSNPTP